MADTNMKITDASTITTMAGTDKMFVNSGGDLKQIELDKAVAASEPVKTLNSNLGNIKYYVDVTSIPDLLNKIANFKSAVVMFHLCGSSYNGGDLPNDKYYYSSGIIFYRNQTSCKIVIFTEGELPLWKLSTWNNWRDFSGNIIS